MYFHTHDAALGERLRELELTAGRAWDNVVQRLPAMTDAEAADHPPPTVVIAHPHGRMKHVTVGELQGTASGRWVVYPKVLYSAATCPGSSGGLVMPLWRWRSETVMGGGFVRGMRCHPHSVGWPSGQGRSADHWGFL